MIIYSISSIPLDPEHPFQKLTAIVLSNTQEDITIDELFSFSLSPYPASLAKSVN